MHVAVLQGQREDADQKELYLLDDKEMYRSIEMDMGSDQIDPEIHDRFRI